MRGKVYRRDWSEGVGMRGRKEPGVRDEGEERYIGGTGVKE